MSWLVWSGTWRLAGEARAAAALPAVARTERSGPKVGKLQEQGVTGWGKEDEKELYFLRLLGFTGCSVILVALKELPILISPPKISFS